MQKVDVQSMELNIGKSGRIRKKYTRPLDIDMLLLPLIALPCAFYVFIVILPVYGLFHTTDLSSLLYSVFEPGNLSAIRLSMLTSILSLAAVFLFGTPVVFFISDKRNSALAKCVEIMASMPAVLPPAVAGIGLLIAFGSHGIFGYLLKQLNIDIVFTPLAVILAQFFVSSGYYIQVLKTGLDAIEREIFEAAYVFGAGKIETYVKIILPMLKKPIIAGLILAWTRSLGEFGATMLFAGNIEGKTRTIPLQIYTLMQTDIKLAASVSVLLFLLSFTMLLTVKFCFKGDANGYSNQ